MNRNFFRSVVFGGLITAAVFFAARTPADTLTTLDGQSLIGRVEKTDTGYIVHTADGVVEVKAENVKHVMLDHAADRTPGKKKAVDPKTLQTLQDQGKAAYAAGAFDVSRDLYADALHVDPGNPVSARGLGMALMRLDHPVQAREPLEQAYAAMPNDRELLIVMSTAQIEAKNPMRAVKFLKQYMEKNPAVVDEDCLNALGAGLSQADAVASKQPLFAQAFKLYLSANAKLEAQRPGEKRWGSVWLSTDEVAKKLDQHKSAEADIAAAQKKVNSAANRLSTAQKDLAASMPGSASRVDRATADLASAQKALADATADAAATEPAAFPLLVTLDSASAESASAPASTQPVEATTGPAGEPAGQPTTGPTNVAVNNTPGPAGPPVSAGPTTGPSPDVVAMAKPAPPIARAVKPNAPPAEPAGPVTKYGAAFAVAPDLIVAPASVISGSKSIHVDVAVGPSFDATVIRADAADGLVLIRVPGAHFMPYKFADRAADKQTTSLGYPSVDIFNPIAETMVVTRSLSGAADHAKFSIPPRIPGAPLLQDGAVVGMELGGRDTDPSEVPVVSVDVIRKFVGKDAATAAEGADSVVQLVALR